MRGENDRVRIRHVASVWPICSLFAHLRVISLRDASDNCSANWASRNLVNSSAEDQACTVKAEMCVPTRHHLGSHRGHQADHALIALLGLELVVAVVLLLLLVVRAVHGVIEVAILNNSRRHYHLPADR